MLKHAFHHRRRLPSSSRLLSSYGKWVADGEKYDAEGGLAVFGSYANSYDSYRPGYPPELWRDTLGTSSLPKVRRAVDVCAGTGRGAKALHRWGVEDVIAVDFDQGMLAEIGEGIATVQASAEHMPTIKDGDVDLVTCLQAFHWLDAARTLDEFERILTPRGKALIAWNDRDLGDDFVDALESLIERYNPQYTRALKIAENYLPSIERHGAFGITRRDYVNEQRLTANDFVQQLFTFSYVKNVLGESESESIERDVRRLILEHYGLTKNEQTFTMKWTTKAFFLNKP